MKKVLLIVIDGLATRVLKPAMDAGRLPNLAALAQSGVLHEQCTSIFPSITPAATCAIATGCYPRDHSISGAYWYDSDRDEVAYFGSDIWPILSEGIGDFLRDFQIKLNCERLQAPTIFEHIERSSDLVDAVVNYMWFRGTVQHQATTPLLLQLLSAGSMEATMPGPRRMYLADFVSTPAVPGGEPLQARGGITRRYGFHDVSTCDYLLGMAKAGPLPDFTLAYFPNNDFKSHEVGAVAAEPVLLAIDNFLGEFFETCGGLRKLLDETTILITGDHSHTDMSPTDNAGIDLTDVLKDLKVVPAGSKWESDDDVMPCPNLRAAQIYFRTNSWDNRRVVIESMLDCPAIDQVIVPDEANDERPENRYHVLTADRGELEFWCVGIDEETEDDAQTARDDYGAMWQWEGDLATVDVEVTADGHLEFGDYPNAFERIAMSFTRHSGTLWATARVGCEFCLPGTHVNPGGSHGSLHTLDSSAPLLAVGLPASVVLPSHLRIVDVAPLCLQILEIEPDRKPGESHMVSGAPQHCSAVDVT